LSVVTSPSSPPAANPFLIAADLFDPPPDPYVADPVGFARDVLGFEPWSKQVAIMESVRDNARTAVRACHGVGKTATAAHVALWFLAVHPGSRVISTAPTFAQVEYLLWVAIRAAIARAHGRGQGGQFAKPNRTSLEMGEDWFALGLSTNEPERFQGHHADHLLLICDEASGVEEPIYEAAEGFLTAAGAKVLLIGNPTKIGGQFHRAFTQEKARWSQIHISAYDSPNVTGEPVPANVARALVTPEWIEGGVTTWGRDSAPFAIKVLGDFAEQGPDTVIALSLIDEAQTRFKIRAAHGPPPDSGKERVVIGCDVARFGSDETVIAERIGNHVRLIEKFVGKPTTFTVGRITEYAARHPLAHVRMVIDDTGVGGGVTDQLRAAGWNVTAFNGGEKPIREDRYKNRRSELWFEGAAQMPDLDLDPDDQLAADLTAPKYTFNEAQRRVVERKDETKKRLGRSPDRGDAVLLTLVPGQSLGAVAPAPPGTPDTGISDEALLNDPM
jgi:phage terminase large subunit